MRTNFENHELLVDLFRAYFDARRHKANTANALAFAAGYEEKLIRLYEDIVSRRYEISRSMCFIVNKPVKREIFAADFRDRVVHHLLFNYLNPLFETHFIKDSYSCRVGKGTSYGIDRVAHFMRSCSENYCKPCWVLKLDIQGYFMSMDKHILWRNIEERLLSSHNVDFDKETAFYLLRKVIFNDPTKACTSKGSRQDWVGLPKSKSLFFSSKNTGFPLGNLTSQLFANIYLDAFDHYVKETLHVKYYGRYVDDMLFVHEDKEFLLEVVEAVRGYLRTMLNLRLHPKKIYLQSLEHGMLFLGAYLKPWRIYAGKRTKGNFYSKIWAWNKEAKSGHGFSNQDDAMGMLSPLNSYLGFLGQYDTYALRKKVVNGMDRAILASIVFSKDMSKASVSIQGA